MECLNLLPHVGGVEELDEVACAGGETARLGGGDGGQRPGGVAHEKRLLRVDAGLAKAGAGESVLEPVPANVAGPVLPARPGEQVVAPFLPGISAAGAARDVLPPLLPGFTVVGGGEPAGPLLPHDALQHR